MNELFELSQKYVNELFLLRKEVELQGVNLIFYDGLLHLFQLDDLLKICDNIKFYFKNDIYLTEDMIFELKNKLLRMEEKIKTLKTFFC